MCTVLRRFLLLLTVLVVSVNIAIATNSFVAQQWSQAAITFDKILWPQADTVTQFINVITSEERFKLNENCTHSLRLLVNGIEARKLWALQFLESSAPTKSNFLQGFIADLGDFDECIHIKANELINSVEHQIYGQYCVISFNFPLPSKPNLRNQYAVKVDLNATNLNGTYYEMYASDVRALYNEGINFAICVPLNCDQKQIEQIVNEYFKSTNLILKTKSCSSLSYINSVHFNDQPTHRRYSLYALIAIITFIWFATYMSENETEDRGLISKVLASFSVIKNTEKLLQSRDESQKKELNFIHGIRFWFHTFTIFGHLIGMYALLPFYFAVFRKVDFGFNHWMFQEVISNALVGIAMFFFLSGFLAYYSFYPEMKRRQGRLSFFPYIIKRWMRTTPALIGVILFQQALALNVKNANPISWDVINMLERNCANNWWWNLLYINNWLNPTEQCVFNTWSLSVEWQLYIIGFFVIKQLYTNPKRGLILTITLILIGTGMSSYSVYYFDTSPFVEMLTPQPDFFLKLKYNFHTYNYMSTYFLGVLTAYLVNNNIRPKRKIYYALMFIIVSNVYALLYGIPYRWKLYGESRWQEIIFAGIHRPMFAMFYAWLFYYFTAPKTQSLNKEKCEQKPKSNKGILYKLLNLWKKMLSWKFYIPFSRMTYSIYLSENFFLGGDIVTSDRLFSFKSYDLAQKWLYLLIVCSIAGYFVYIFFEAPFINLMKNFYQKGNAENIEIQKSKKS